MGFTAFLGRVPQPVLFCSEPPLAPCFPRSKSYGLCLPSEAWMIFFLAFLSHLLFSFSLSHSCLSNMALVLPSPWKVLTTNKCIVWFLIALRVLFLNSPSEKSMLLPILISHWHFVLIAWFLFFSLLLYEMLYISFIRLVYCWSPSLKHKPHKGRNPIVFFTPMTSEQSREHS